MQIFMLNVKESLREAAKKCESLAQKVLQRLLHFVNPPRPVSEDRIDAVSKIIEQNRISKKRSGRSKVKTNQTSSRNRVQRKAKRSSKKG